jgi:hypothetical protein
MMNTQTLVALIDSFGAVIGETKDTTLSHRIFGDSKKLGALRTGGADITVGRYNATMAWLAANWPQTADRPAALAAFAPASTPEVL